MTTAPLPPGLAREYEVVDRLGAGAMGQVLLAEHRGLGRRVALKFLHVTDDAELTARFAREAAALARLQHPHIVEVYDHGVVEGVPYLAMEYLEGGSLQGRRPEDPLAVMLPVARALEVVHAAGLVHRDVKPANIMRAGDGRPVLVDFGLLRGDSSATLTKTGAVVGTPVYLAPEVLQTGRSAAPSDWWAWGVSLYELATGERPFEARHILATMSGAALPPPRPPSDPALARVLRACLDPDPARRPTSAKAIEALAAGTAADAAASGARRRSSSRSRERPRPAGAGPSARARVGGALGIAALVALAAWGLRTVPAPTEVPSPPGALEPGGPPPVELTATLRVTAQGATVFRTARGRHALLVPDGTFVARLSPTPGIPGPEERVYLDAFLLDLCAVRVEEYARFLTDTGREPPPGWGAQREHDPDAPVVNVAYADAEAYAAWAGGRLPTARQWARAAGGITGVTRPWEEAADLPRGLQEGKQAEPPAQLRHLYRVDHSEGAAATGALGMFGNAASWVRGPEGPAVMGAARCEPRELRSSWLLRPPPTEGHALSLGFRVAYVPGPEAVPATRLEPPEDLGARLRSTARGWRDPVGNHEILDLPARRAPLRVRTSDHLGAPGEPRVTAVPAFRMDRDEATAGRFSLFLAATGRTVEAESWAIHQAREHWFPVYDVSWEDARDFCAFSGGRLPTPEEWERAASGGEGWTYPWGEAPPDRTRANFGHQDVEARFKARGYLERAGRFPAGDTQEGLRDMAGNLYEWTAERQGDEAWIMGGNFISPPELLRTWAARGWRASSYEIGIGIRCAYDP